MKLSFQSRLVLSIPFFAVPNLVPAVLLGFPLDMILVHLRRTTCSDDTILVIKPYLGDLAYNVPVILALEIFFLANFIRWIVSISAAGSLSAIDPQWVIAAKKTTWGTQIVALCGLVFMLFEYNHAQQTCIKGSGIEYRATLGQPVLYPWRAVTGVSVDCLSGAGKGSRWDFWLYLADGKQVGIDLNDIVSNPANQVTFWQHVYDNHIPVKLDVFQSDQPYCWRDFPGLRPQA